MTKIVAVTVALDRSLSMAGCVINGIQLALHSLCVTLRYFTFLYAWRDSHH